MKSSNNVKSYLSSSLHNSFSFHSWGSLNSSTQNSLHLPSSGPIQMEVGDLQPASALCFGHWDILVEKVPSPFSYETWPWTLDLKLSDSKLPRTLFSSWDLDPELEERRLPVSNLSPHVSQAPLTGWDVLTVSH